MQSKAETLDVYDARGRRTGRVRTRGETFSEGEYHLAASLWIANSEGKLLIQKRSPQKIYKPGYWSITGGAVLAGESSRQACVREVAEEIGIKFRPRELKFLSRSFGQNIIYEDFAALRDFEIQEAALQPGEVSEIKWAGVCEIERMFQNGEFIFDDIAELRKVAAFIAENAYIKNNSALT